MRLLPRTIHTLTTLRQQALSVALKLHLTCAHTEHIKPIRVPLLEFLHA